MQIYFLRVIKKDTTIVHSELYPLPNARSKGILKLVNRLFFVYLCLLLGPTYPNLRARSVMEHDGISMLI